MARSDGFSAANYTEKMGLPWSCQMVRKLGSSVVSYTETMDRPRPGPVARNAGIGMVNKSPRRSTPNYVSNPGAPELILALEVVIFVDLLLIRVIIKATMEHREL
jgi:hypothetical protein